MPGLHSYGNPYLLARLVDKSQIRLLKVQAHKNGDGEIQCEMRTVNLDDGPNYVALSYTWGPPTDRAAEAGVTSDPLHAIACNGGTIKITQNLYDFFQRAIQHPDLSSRWLWIDSVCINQDDPLERSSQVSLMASIYRSAERVIAWLGEEDTDTEYAFSLITTLATLCEDCARHIRPQNMLSQSKEFSDILGPLSHSKFWSCMRRFWRRRYFQRAWIIQELALAKTVTAKCGSHTMDWEHIHRTSWFLTVSGWTESLNARTSVPTERWYSNHALPLYIGATKKWVESENARAFLYALVRARRFQCADLRDKVYAVLGLCANYTEGKSRLRPIYGDRSVANTYIATAIQILEDVDDLLLLAQVEGKDYQIVDGLPSWVPDWSCARGLGLGLVGYTRFTAASDLTKSVQINEQNMMLTLRGLQLDTVIQIGETKDSALRPSKRAYHYFPGWLSILSSLAPIYHTGQPKNEVFWRTLITDTASHIPLPARHPAAEEYVFAFRGWLTRIIDHWLRATKKTAEEEDYLKCLMELASGDLCQTLPGTAESEQPTSNTIMDSSYESTASRNGDLPDADDYAAIFNHSCSTRLIRTSSNYLGLATTSVREGDTVWIISGSRVPLVLREAGPTNTYSLVGGAYIHGLMRGEALSGNDTLVDVKII
jgi:hypothetical protein